MKLKDRVAKVFSSSTDVVFLNGEKKLPPALIKWQAPEFYLVDKSIAWGVVLIVVMLALATIMAILGQYLVGVVCILFMIVVLKFAYAKPEAIEYRVEEGGVRISGWLHPYYDDIVAFWTASYRGKHTIYLQSKNILVGYLTLPTGDKPLKKIVKALEKFLPEQTPAQVPRVKATKS